jgi:hypothetical protein
MPARAATGRRGPGCASRPRPRPVAAKPPAHRRAPSSAASRHESASIAAHAPPNPRMPGVTIQPATGCSYSSRELSERSAQRRMMPRALTAMSMPPGRAGVGRDVWKPVPEDAGWPHGRTTSTLASSSHELDTPLTSGADSRGSRFLRREQPSHRRHSGRVPTWASAATDAVATAKAPRGPRRGPGTGLSAGPVDRTALWSELDRGAGGRELLACREGAAAHVAAAPSEPAPRRERAVSSTQRTPP